ncbi:unnamed protein product [Paramecium primaurelia]|uniref:Chromo shadow domain-containing protein n=1 Tax=Paramecium primaurelia TaxID=5886 RepID=A0A8S1NBQ0_PARPR|nr:unnamed protein product [Paramecium primaurelia]
MPKIIPISIFQSSSSFKIIIIRMYNNKFPIELIKKKVQENTISYKFRWNNGTISIEPMIQLTPQLLELVHQYELRQYYEINKKVKLNQTEIPSESLRDSPSNLTKDETKISLLKNEDTSKTIQKAPIKSLQESNYQSNTILPQDIIPQIQQSNPKQYLQKTFVKHTHLPRKNKKCIIKSITRNNGDIMFLINDDEIKWVKLEDLKRDSPITLCDYLLSKVRFK